MSLCFLIPALVGLISGILGYLLGKMSSNNSNNGNASLSLQSDLDACRANNAKLNLRISDLEKENAAKSAAVSGAQNFTQTANLAAKETQNIPFNADLAFSILGKKVKHDDLKIVEGIGPKIEELYHNAGVKTWKALSETSLEKSQSILNDAGERYAIHNPSTWAKQAELAYLGKWEELKEWQDKLDGGKE